MATEEGFVIKLESATTARVKTNKKSACAGCASRKSCNGMGDDMEVEALNPAGAQVGDRILLRIETGSLLKATFLLYLFPIICMLVGAVIGQLYASLIGFDASALLGFLFFFLSILFVKFKGNRMATRSSYRPKIVKILNPLKLEQDDLAQTVGAAPSR
ncbi:MAG: SoxR reducing system RseC family protein [Desulfobacterales bacterium]|nr:SoxR reducing system RseC family protein [Desulfobacterales bacterium]